MHVFKNVPTVVDNINLPLPVVELSIQQPIQQMALGLRFQSVSLRIQTSQYQPNPPAVAIKHQSG